MADDQKKILPIDYTHREFNSIRQDLMEIAERFYPDTFQDFSEASFGSIMLDATAYVGDQLSLYLDYNVNEAFLDTAYQRSNILRHGRIMGYKDTGRPSTYGQVALFVMVPASATGIGPDRRYIPILKKGSRFTSQTGLSFVLLENVDFSAPQNPVVIAQSDQSTNAPTQFAIKAYGNVVSGYFSRKQITIGPYERYLNVKIGSANISEIISVVDSEGNDYFEVDYLSQDIVFKEVANENFKNDNVPSVIKPVLISRKFVVERDRSNVYLQFGSGKADETGVIANPQNVALEIFGKDYVTDTTFDPSRLSKNESFGFVPANTTLTITYRTTNPANSNVAVGGINKVANALLEYEDQTSLSLPTLQNIRNNVEVINEIPIVGNVTSPNSAEIKRRIFDTFPTQNRAVTQADYENLTYRMPAKFGSVKRVSTQKDPNSLKRNLNMYVVSEDQYGNLTKTNQTIKNNIKTWLNQYRMINDTIDILDPYIINLGIDFVVKAQAGADKYDVLNRCINTIASKYNEDFFIGEPFYISEVYETLKNVNGVLDVVKVKLNNKVGGSYADTILQINTNLSSDGSYLMVPNNGIVEIKYPTQDIRGKIR
jgi:hypothetical protein|tara:strand:+ start:33385 stop:35181 length:1797 start_codon:yes stop_codon:yes gene_type:complete